jgi:hypothetical protein
MLSCFFVILFRILKYQRMKKEKRKKEHKPDQSVALTETVPWKLHFVNAGVPLPRQQRSL